MDIEESAYNTAKSEGSEYQENGDSFIFSTDKNQTITSPPRCIYDLLLF